MGNVSTLSMLAMVVSFVISVFFPLGLCIYMKAREHVSLKYFFLGCGTFILFAFVLEQIPHFVVGMAAGDYFKEHFMVYALYGGFAAGLFEETGRYVAMKYWMKKNLNKKSAVMYGIGHGGVEAIVIGSLACISNLVNSILLNAGQLDALSGNAAANSTLVQLVELPAWQFLLVGMERFSTVILHICLSYLVYLAVKRKKSGFYILAILIHWGIDTILVAAAQFIPTIIIEVCLLAVMLIFAWIVCKAYRNEPLDIQPE